MPKRNRLPKTISAPATLDDRRLENLLQLSGNLGSDLWDPRLQLALFAARADVAQLPPALTEIKKAQPKHGHRRPAPAAQVA